MKNYDFWGVKTPLKIAMEFYQTKIYGKYIGMNPTFPLKFDFKVDEDINKYSLASCERIVKIRHT